MRKINFYLLIAAERFPTKNLSCAYVLFPQQSELQNTQERKVDHTAKEGTIFRDSNTLSCDDELIDWLRDVLALNGFDLWNNNKALRGENVDFQEETDWNWFLTRQELISTTKSTLTRIKYMSIFFLYTSWELKN